MNQKQTAVNNFKNGYNCAQAVLTSIKEDSPVSEEELKKLSCGFGAGMGRLQETCGAVTGAYMVIGLKYGNYENDLAKAKEKTYEMVRLFEKEFKKLHGTTNCKELLGCNLLTEEGRKFFKSENLMEKICVGCVEDAVEILCKI